MTQKTIYSTILILVIAGLILWSVPLSLFAPREISEVSLTDQSLKENIQVNQTMESKTILMVVAFDGFQDEEYFIPKEAFETADFLVETTSLQKGVAQGVDGGETIINIEAEKIQVDKYIAVVFCGGSGMAQELDNEVFQKLAKDFNKENKLVSAICVAPALLAKSGVLENKKATVWSSVLNKDYIKIIEENGGIYEDNPVVISEKIITANGPAAAEEFGEEIIGLLNN